MLVCVACNCGSSDKLIRSRLQRFGYKDFLKIKIDKGKDKSLAALNNIPQYPEVDLLRNHIKDRSKYAVVLGCSENGCRWADVARGDVKEDIELELIVKNFG